MIKSKKRNPEQLPKRISDNIYKYLEKSKDTELEYFGTETPEHLYMPDHNNCWADFDVYDDILWINTAFSADVTDTKKAWVELKEIAKSLKCKKIQFTTRRNGKIWEKLFNDMKVVQWKIEVQL